MLLYSCAPDILFDFPFSTIELKETPFKEPLDFP
uniref:Uncharacterized protein n=1 Tax=Anguilla anguilla TaxID=7936 RepID=A0A0E9PQ43_ANGAN